MSTRPPEDAVARKGERFNAELTEHRIKWGFFGRVAATQIRGLLAAG